MNDALPAWFWIPLAIALWAVLLFPLFIRVFTADVADPDELTPLDILERTGIYPHAAVPDRPRR